jgi:hypothetical protein
MPRATERTFALEELPNEAVVSRLPYGRVDRRSLVMAVRVDRCMTEHQDGQRCCCRRVKQTAGRALCYRSGRR